ncbi:MULTISPECIES: amino acid adenylation domain-containing protein [unclassified Streptomyces]|uniref:amino acid adenylation domain-containing protein n=1 Tax=unclassified Streptomyces TaxID=2593676 RepID=UPI00109E5480|nr:amino acid adenylation domain-containing protein [Streptomyces sp. A1136]THA54658.1 amino acid adenylation domain-containing protein [Streptomyces sp. A1136]
MTFQETSVLEPTPLGTKALPDLLAERVAEHPEATAVVYRDQRLTYRELAARSSALAEYLRHLGVSADDCVGLFVEPSLDLMIGAWGILSAGGAYLPLSPEYPEDRLRYMIENSQTKIILGQQRLVARLRELAPKDVTVVTLRDCDAFLLPEGTPAPAAEGIRPDNLAYVIYTSGSTGKPKGVMIEHRSVVNQLGWLREAHGIDRSKVVLQKTPMSFDAAQWEILSPANGATVVMGAPGVYADPEGLMETIRKHGVTTLQCVPTLLQALIDTEQFDACSSLEQIFSGGEALSRNLALQVTREMPGRALINLYGPTECTINSSSHTVDPEVLDEGPQSISIGSPVHRTEYHILDKDLRPVGDGEIGELYIGGVQLARGYLHRPDLTADRFLDIALTEDAAPTRLYKTGDLAQWNPDGTVQFAGRADNQVKLRGYRVELDEISLAIENHEWVRNAAVIVKNDGRTGFQNLIACVELSEKEAALMDQGNHGSHHASKKSKLQVKAQLSNPGLRDDAELAARPAFDLEGSEPTPEQRARVFARKTYRFYEGGAVTRADLLDLLGAKVAAGYTRGAADLAPAELGQILRWFGQYVSEERLLPKYGYASPGALYATQMYFELEGVGGLKPGYYYYQPVRHQLVLISEREATGKPTAQIHFIGKKSGIEPVYKNNIIEVLEIETGHMVGLFEQILPAYGLDIHDRAYEPAVRELLDVADEDYYLGTFELVPHAGPREDHAEVYVQTHGGKIAGLPEGQYRYANGELTRFSDDIVLKKHVIAINQSVYQAASFGISVYSRAPQEWLRYITLGKKLQHLMMNGLNLGFMSSGYSSKTGNPLPASRRMDAVLAANGVEGGPMYFFVGGRVSEEQIGHEGMREDSVHMRGPAELIRDDLAGFLPDYMIPNRVVVFERMPLSANGKVDVKALAASEQVNAELVERPFVAPRTETEKEIAGIWEKALRRESASVQDDFFESGGNSLIAVGLVRELNARLGVSLPLQSVLESPTIEKLARRLEREVAQESSRLVRLHAETGKAKPVICWPGLGGYPMNLRSLAGEIDLGRSFYGVQSHGINEGETPYATITEMAKADIEAIKELQPTGPYTLWGYSFGARVAFETAYQLEQAGEKVDNLFLIAPGSPKVRAENGKVWGREASFANRGYTTILFSVFTGTISGPDLEKCLETVTDEESFAEFISELKGIDVDLARRIISVVGQTYEFEYSFHELAERTLQAPISIFKAVGDDYSFLENSSGYSAEPPTVIDLDADHYSLLREDIGELVKHIRYLLGEE